MPKDDRSELGCIPISQLDFSLWLTTPGTTTTPEIWSAIYYD